MGRAPPDPLEGDDVDIGYAGMPLVGSRELTIAERERIAREITRATRVVGFCVAAPLVVASVVAALLAASVDSHVFVLPACVALLFGLPAAIGFGQSAMVQRRRLRQDGAAPSVRVFRGDEITVGRDEALAHLVRVGRFDPEVGRAVGTHTIELLPSGLPLPRAGERLSPHVARPSRVARVPARLAPPGGMRPLTTTERAELRQHAWMLRRVTIAEGALLVYGVVACFALATGAAFGTRLGAAPAVIVTGLALVAAWRSWRRRSDARSLVSDAERGEVVGRLSGEMLPSGRAWTVANRQAAWRRA